MCKKTLLRYLGAVYAQMWNFTEISKPVKMDYNVKIDAVPNISSLSIDVIAIGNRMDLVAAYSTSSNDIHIAHYTTFLQNGELHTNGSISTKPLTLGITPTVSMEIVNETIMV
jgi:hypothetical protein